MKIHAGVNYLHVIKSFVSKLKEDDLQKSKAKAETLEFYKRKHKLNFSPLLKFTATSLSRTVSGYISFVTRPVSHFGVLSDQESKSKPLLTTRITMDDKRYSEAAQWTLNSEQDLNGHTQWVACVNIDSQETGKILEREAVRDVRDNFGRIEVKTSMKVYIEILQDKKVVEASTNMDEVQFSIRIADKIGTSNKVKLLKELKNNIDNLIYKEENPGEGKPDQLCAAINYSDRIESNPEQFFTNTQAATRDPKLQVEHKKGGDGPINVWQTDVKGKSTTTNMNRKFTTSDNLNVHHFTNNVSFSTNIPITQYNKAC